jgi:hypothetical protein
MSLQKMWLLPVGSYHVVINKPEPDVPEKYRTPGRSGLMIEVKEGENTLDCDLATEWAFSSAKRCR